MPKICQIVNFPFKLSFLYLLDTFFGEFYLNGARYFFYFVIHTADISNHLTCSPAMIVPLLPIAHSHSHNLSLVLTTTFNPPLLHLNVKHLTSGIISSLLIPL